jgi:speckle-type POZ protein
MTSESEAVMIVPYEWMPENVEEDEPMTIASKMIWFRGQRVFRVGLKNHALNPVFFLFAIDLNKMGMKVKDVKFGMQCSGLCPTKMKEMIREDMDDEGSLQLFTIKLYEEDLGNCTFSFRICIEGTADSYSYQLCDRRAKNQLWAALEGQLNLADVEFIVKDKTYPAHKAILAARSPVFADKFEKKQLVKDVPHQIRIDGVQPSTVLNFLHFIYTGEPIGTLANEELLKLAEYYQLTTLVNLCKLAAKKVNALKITNIMKHLNSNASEEMSSSKIT